VSLFRGFGTVLARRLAAAFERGWPRDAFYAKGTLGQYVVVVPSERLVIVRLGRSPNWPPEADGVFELVRDVVAATGSKGKRLNAMRRISLLPLWEKVARSAG
jgi:CubicO group peptidase (beta-lactamase class C family)